MCHTKKGITSNYSVYNLTIISQSFLLRVYFVIKRKGKPCSILYIHRNIAFSSLDGVWMFSEKVFINFLILSKKKKKKITINLLAAVNLAAVILHIASLTVGGAKVEKYTQNYIQLL